MNPKRLKELREALMELRDWTQIEGGLERENPRAAAVWREVNDWCVGMARDHNLDLNRTATERVERQRQIFP